MFGHRASGIMIIFCFCLIFCFLFIAVFQGKKENPVSFWYRDIPVFCKLGISFMVIVIILFYSSKERHKFQFKGKKTAIMSTNILSSLYISSIHMLLPENKYLNIYIYKYIDI